MANAIIPTGSPRTTAPPDAWGMALYNPADPDAPGFISWMVLSTLLGGSSTTVDQIARDAAAAAQATADSAANAAAVAEQTATTVQTNLSTHESSPHNTDTTARTDAAAALAAANAAQSDADSASNAAANAAQAAAAVQTELDSHETSPHNTDTTARNAASAAQSTADAASAAATANQMAVAHNQQTIATQRTDFDAHAQNPTAHQTIPDDILRDLGDYSQLTLAERTSVKRGWMVTQTHGAIQNQVWICWSPALANTPRAPGQDSSGWRPVSGAVHPITGGVTSRHFEAGDIAQVQGFNYYIISPGTHTVTEITADDSTVAIRMGAPRRELLPDPSGGTIGQVPKIAAGSLPGQQEWVIGDDETDGGGGTGVDRYKGDYALLDAAGRAALVNGDYVSVPATAGHRLFWMVGHAENARTNAPSLTIGAEATGWDLLTELSHWRGEAEASATGYHPGDVVIVNEEEHQYVGASYATFTAAEIEASDDWLHLLDMSHIIADLDGLIGNTNWRNPVLLSDAIPQQSTDTGDAGTSGRASRSDHRHQGDGGGGGGGGGTVDQTARDAAAAAQTTATSAQLEASTANSQANANASDITLLYAEPTWHNSASAAPASTDGSNGDYWRRNSDQQVWHKAGGSWTSLGFFSTVRTPTGGGGTNNQHVPVYIPNIDRWVFQRLTQSDQGVDVPHYLNSSLDGYTFSTGSAFQVRGDIADWLTEYYGDVVERSDYRPIRETKPSNVGNADNRSLYRDGNLVQVVSSAPGQIVTMHFIDQSNIRYYNPTGDVVAWPQGGNTTPDIAVAYLIGVRIVPTGTGAHIEVLFNGDQPSGDVVVGVGPIGGTLTDLALTPSPTDANLHVSPIVTSIPSGNDIQFRLSIGGSVVSIHSGNHYESLLGEELFEERVVEIEERMADIEASVNAQSVAVARNTSAITAPTGDMTFDTPSITMAFQSGGWTQQSGGAGLVVPSDGIYRARLAYDGLTSNVARRGKGLALVSRTRGADVVTGIIGSDYSRGSYGTYFQRITAAAEGVFECDAGDIIHAQWAMDRQDASANTLTCAIGHFELVVWRA